MSDCINDFLVAKEVESGCSRHTITAYRYDLQYLLKTVGNLPIDQVQIYHVRKVLKVFSDRQYSKAGINRKIACFKTFFRFCMENELITKNPLLPIKSPKIRPEENLPKFLSYEEMMHILSFLQTSRASISDRRYRLKVIIQLLYSTMIRISELCGLMNRDVDFQNGLIKVRGKGNKERYIPVDPSTLHLLTEYIDYRRFEMDILANSGVFPLFVNQQGTALHPRTVQKELQVLKSQLGFSPEKRLTPHIFRHTGATHLRQNGMDISELQDLLGHANLNTTRIYAKNDLQRLKLSYLHNHPLNKS